MKALGMLTAVVLVAIGIGMRLVGGASYATPTLKTYEVRPYAFVAAFTTLEGKRLHVTRNAASPDNHRQFGLVSFDAWNTGPDPWTAFVDLFRLNTWFGARVYEVLEGMGEVKPEMREQAFALGASVHMGIQLPDRRLQGGAGMPEGGQRPTYSVTLTRRPPRVARVVSDGYRAELWLGN